LPLPSSDVPWFVESHKNTGGNWFRKLWPQIGAPGVVAEGNEHAATLLRNLQQIERGMPVRVAEALLADLEPTSVTADKEWEARVYTCTFNPPLRLSSDDPPRQVHEIAFRLILWKGRWVAAVEEIVE